MIWPPLLILVALSTAAAVAFGTHPGWADHEGGLDVILWSRRLQWLLVAASIVACLGLIAVSVTSRRRALWLIGLAPVLALFAQRFAGDRPLELGVVEDPTFVAVGQADFVKDDDWVVGLKLGDKAYAYPFAVLYAEPVVLQAEHDKRIALLWNAQANRALALSAAPELRGRDLDWVSSPAGSLLLYNARHGQFVVGVTGLTPDRQKVAGFGAPVATTKTTFGKWRSANPAGRVMRASPRAAALALVRPTKPMEPTPPGATMIAVVRPATQPATATGVTGLTPGPALASTTGGGSGGGEPAVLAVAGGKAVGLGPTICRRVTLVGVGKPAAVDVGSLSQRPNAVSADDRSAVLLRTDGSASAVRAFSRSLDDLTLRFESRKDAKLADVRMADPETGSLWSANGVAIGGTPQFRGRRLQSLPVDEDVDLAIMRRWLPELEVYAEPAPPSPPPSQVAGKGNGTATRPARVKTSPKKAPAADAPSGKAPVAKPAAGRATAAKH